MYKKNGVRWLLIAGMNREQMIAFITSKDSAYKEQGLETVPDVQLYKIAREVDQKFREQRMKKKAAAANSVFSSKI